MQPAFIMEGDAMGAQTARSNVAFGRPGFSSLREAHAIWRVLKGEDAKMVASDLDVPLNVLLPWIQESQQGSIPRETDSAAPLLSDPVCTDGQTAFPSL
jgi:hypothetical protein